jgi:transcriptional regulator with XRE-family HTH domain
MVACVNKLGVSVKAYPHMAYLAFANTRAITKKNKRTTFFNARQKQLRNKRLLKNYYIYCHKLTRQMKETFGEYIKRLRTENELTLTQLAAKLDLDSANLSKIENNKREFDEKRLKLLANVFNLDLANLRAEFFSDIIAKKIFDNNCDSETLILAEQKVEYLKSKNLTTI